MKRYHYHHWDRETPARGGVMLIRCRTCGEYKMLRHDEIPLTHRGGNRCPCSICYVVVCPPPPEFATVEAAQEWLDARS